MIRAAESPQLYVPADPGPEPYAWFTMEMLLWWGAAVTLLLIAAIGMAAALARRVNRLEDAAVDLTTIAASTRADLDHLHAHAHRHPDEDEAEWPTQPADRVLIGHAFDERPSPRPRASAGRHAHPED